MTPLCPGDDADGPQTDTGTSPPRRPASRVGHPWWTALAATPEAGAR